MVLKLISRFHADMCDDLCLILFRRILDTCRQLGSWLGFSLGTLIITFFTDILGFSMHWQGTW